MIKKFLAPALAAALGLLLLSGCGDERLAASSFPEDSGGTPISAMTTPSSISSTTDSSLESSDVLPPEGTPIPEPEDSLPAYLASETSEVYSGPEEAKYNPEGLAAIPGEAISLSENAKLAKIGETVTPESSLGFYDLTINKAVLTKDRVEGLDAEKVVRIVYTYTSTDYDDELRVNSLFFRLYDADDKACAPYLFGEEKEYPSAESVKPGESCTATVCFSLPKDSKTATLVFDDRGEELDPEEYYWELEF